MRVVGMAWVLSSPFIFRNDNTCDWGFYQMVPFVCDNEIVVQVLFPIH